MRRAAILLVLLLGLPLPAQAAGVSLAAHRALYAMTLDRARGNVIAASGVMGFEVMDACEGWAVRQRLDMKVTNADGQTIEMISDYATWESKDGKRLRFHMKQTTDEAVTSQTDGGATLDHSGGGGVAHYTQPRRMTQALPPGTLFPMHHTEALIEAAKAGRKFLAVPLFDGTSENGADLASAVITRRDPPEPSRWAALAHLPSLFVHLAFFDFSSKEALPDYQVGQKYWDNGVSDDMTMDFGDFVMHAKMTEFSLQPKRC